MENLFHQRTAQNQLVQFIWEISEVHFNVQLVSCNKKNFAFPHNLNRQRFFFFLSTIKPLYDVHPWDTKNMAIVKARSNSELPAIKLG
jgi:hypothetical protein